MELARPLSLLSWELGTWNLELARAASCWDLLSKAAVSVDGRRYELENWQGSRKLELGICDRVGASRSRDVRHDARRLRGRDIARCEAADARVP